MKSLSKISAPEAFYRLFQALPTKERFAAARYILEDEEIRHHFKLPNEMTLAAFAEDKAASKVSGTAILKMTGC